MDLQPVDDAALRHFRTRFTGEIIRPADADYDAARTVFNAMIDRRPALIAKCTGVGDVVAAVNFARETGLVVAVRSGGHSVAGTSVCDGGIVIDVRPMKEIAIDPEARTARVGAGVTWGEFDAAAQAFGLATTGGRVSTTGVAGLTLGGGSGWLERSLGLACDNLLSVDLVTAAGETITASATEHPDLFWALHGGGGNFGVATSFEFRLHPVGPIVLAGIMLYPASTGRDLLRCFRNLMLQAPDELGAAFAYVTAPEETFVPEDLRGRLAVLIAVCYAGGVEAGEEVIRPLKAFAPPAVDLIEPMPYATFNCSLDDPPGMQNYWTADYLNQMSDEAIDAIVKHANAMALGPSQTFIVPWGGAVARVPENATPLAKRDAAFVVHPFALWENPAENAEHIAWARAFGADMKRFTSGGVYLNFIGDEGENRIRAAYGAEKYERLAAIKAEYDPGNLFRLNQNIKPRPALVGAR